MPFCRRTLTALFCLLIFSAALNLPSAHAQAFATAERRIGLSAFAGATFLHPDFGADSNIGYTVGGDVTAALRLVDVSLEVRYISANGNYDDQHSLLGGIKVDRGFHRFRPYADFLICPGRIDFDHPNLLSSDFNYTHDSATVYDVGVGVDYALSPRLSLKLDAQGQSWTIGKERPAFHPTNVTAGFVYQIPYHRLRGR